MGMVRGFSTREQRWYQPVPDLQNDGLGQPVGHTSQPIFQRFVFFFSRVFALSFFFFVFLSLYYYVRN
jgi:hypothetical protein